MRSSLLFMDFNISITITFAFGIVIGSATVIGYLVTHPSKLEKLAALIYKCLKYIIKSAEYKYVKFDIQGKVNDFSNELRKRVPNIEPTKVQLEWIDINQNPEQYSKSGELILRMHKSNNQNKNIVSATFAFVSYSLLRKAKSYIALYQRESIDLFVSFKLFEKERIEILDEFVQNYLKDGLEKEKVDEFYSMFFDLDRAGIFFPVFISEMTFLGEKVFGKKRDNDRIFKEVRALVFFLNRYSNRKVDENDILEFIGEYCKFAIRIIGKWYKIDNKSQIYINNLRKIADKVETLYLLGDSANKDFINYTVKCCKDTIDYDIYNSFKYNAKIKDRKGLLFDITNYLIVLRSNKIQVYHQK